VFESENENENKIHHFAQLERTMRYLLELLSWAAMAAGFMGAVAADVFCWREAWNNVQLAEQQNAAATQAGVAAAAVGSGYAGTGASFAIAGAILTAGLAVALVIYLKGGDKSES
jgi:hypothetical protein